VKQEITKGYTCKCGRFNNFSPDEILVHTCGECGEKSTISRSKIIKKKNRGKGKKNVLLKTKAATFKLPLYILERMEEFDNKTAYLKWCALNSDLKLKTRALELGEKYLDEDFDKKLEELKK
jgi:hypothetical protein